TTPTARTGHRTGRALGPLEPEPHVSCNAVQPRTRRLQRECDPHARRNYGIATLDQPRRLVNSLFVPHMTLQ
ncbi:MAG TPA: hypothetical protein VN607_04795, partial [Gemmatimonadaceae bacterium]|nr:hypothetical protein [Gemmatimonadaceae bacterium]